MSDGVSFHDSIESVINLIGQRAAQATAETPSLAGKPYIPGSGSEGAAFEDRICGSCDWYRPHRIDVGVWDCFERSTHKIGILQQAWVIADIADPSYPKQWVYSASGLPTCTSWKTRTAIADEPYPPRLCAGTTTAEEERAAYHRALKGDT